MSRQLHLNAFLMGVGHHEAAWRHPRTDAGRVADVRHYVDVARIAERGLLDSVFFADGLSAGPHARHRLQAVFEPITLLTAIAGATTHIGLIATASTSYYEPFHLARLFASLDHISGGRAGWNIVTSASDAEARNFNRDAAAPHAARYGRAAEFVEVALKLWDSWEAGALVLDPASGIFADTDKIHEVAHSGTHFTVQGPLNSPRSPQGRPLLVQAGSSPDGRAFAARYAEAVFTAQQTLAEAQEFFTALKSDIAAAGRDPGQVAVLPGVVPVIGGTEAEAVRLAREFDDLIVTDHALAQLSQFLDRDLSAYPLDGPLPALPDPGTVEAHQSRFKLIVDLARRDDLSIREILRRLGGGRGHRVVAGTPEQIADELETWFRQGAADGFNVMPPYLPGGLEDFVDHVVPELQRRGLFRTAYTADTLRGHYGLPQPVNAYARVPAAV
ncbi:LLM class flavin-dependent oxidoreductase [Couchioplanes azureus]|uniref:LLM class flavin-dependent oxidoreductase n=1 Tax=Couchioplanes caeruleus TaxID=56438 RepID=UPI001993B3F7|nr:LLM class flavin-dependent oxidoreductase [Couchioplanes caeruleus]GGQ75837.1 monooxygenase [Couchioplanes caeruleus subsp. azureus]